MPRGPASTKAGTPPAAIALPVADSLSHATARRPRGCSPRPAATLGPPKPRMRKVAEVVAPRDVRQNESDVAGLRQVFRNRSVPGASGEGWEWVAAVVGDE